MSDVLLPAHLAPGNLRGRWGTYITEDTLHIAERLQEISPSLYIQRYDEPVQVFGRVYTHVVGEMCGDGVERFVARYEALDQRIIKDVEYMMGVPFEQRLAESERLNEKFEQESREHQLDKLYEEMGGPMLHQLARCHFIEELPFSYSKTNPTARRHRAEARLRRAGC